MKERPADTEPVIEDAQLESIARPGEAPEPLSTRLKRRGLLAGLAGLGAAALIKVTGSDRAEAANGDIVTVGGTYSGTSKTTIAGDITFNPPLTSFNGPSAPGSNGVSDGFQGFTTKIGFFASGVHGEATAANPGGIGVCGAANGGIGVLGKANTVFTVPTLPSAAGVVGLGLSGPGVYGRAATIGLQGETDIASGTGVHGRSTTGVGVHGEGIGATGVGVEGFTAGSGDGVFGASASGKGVHGQSSGFGMYGLSTGNTPSGSAGVFGGASNAPGVQGYSATSIAVHGFCSDVGLGVYGQSLINYGVVAESNTNVALYALSKVPNAAAVYGNNSFVGPGKLAGRFDGDVVVNGNFTVSGGAKAAAVTMADGTKRMMYCQESPEPFFEDFGQSQLSGGSARVNLEPLYASLVKLDNYLVFLTAEGETEGLYVSAKDAGGFTVRELHAGKSAVVFNYRIVAKRKDISGERLAPVAVDGSRPLVSPVAPAVPQNALAASPSVITPAQPGPAGPSAQPGVPGGPKGR